MGRAAKEKRSRRDRPVDWHIPIGTEPIAEWGFDPGTTRVNAVRSANFWQSLPGRKVACDLCYRNCVLRPGEAGWCKIRENRGGELRLTDHGVIANLQSRVQHTPYWRNHAKHVWVSGVSCTSGCTFCTSTHLALHPERLEWAWGERSPGKVGEPGDEGDGGWAYVKGMTHPEGVIDLARRWNCTGVHLGANEPMLTFEYSYDVARLAQSAGLYVHMDTNGFADPDAIRSIAPYIDMAYVGVKGHLDPDFYAKRMRAPGAVPHVQRAIETWKDSGVIVGISDVITPPMWQPDDRLADEQVRRFATWIVEAIGPLTPIELYPMVRPSFGYDEGLAGMLPRAATPDDTRDFWFRVAIAREAMRECGLHYTGVIGHDTTFTCHNCDGIILDRLGWPVFHQFLSDDGHCLHCGTQTPYTPLSDDHYRMIDLEGRHTDEEREAVIAERHRLQAERAAATA